MAVEPVCKYARTGSLLTHGNIEFCYVHIPRGIRNGFISIRKGSDCCRLSNR